MKSLSATLAAIAGLVLFLLLAQSSRAAISCSDVTKDLRPCVNYLVKGSGAPPAACCAGAKALSSAATTTADKRAACACIQSAAKKINPKSQLAQALPTNCGINFPYTISPNVDCSKIS